MEEQHVFVSTRNIVKRYPGVLALDQVDMEFFHGEIHAICGENGAGKSTFIKILTGAIQADSGTILIDDCVCSGFTPHEAMARFGISAIYQEFNLIPALSIAENIFLGNEIRRNGLIDLKEMNSRAKEILCSLEVDLDPSMPVERLAVAYQQLVEIAKATYQNARLLILDEPTAPLAIHEVETLFRLVKRLKSQGITIIYISHRLPEIFELSDRVTVFRDGKKISTLTTSKTTKDELIHLMVNRRLEETYPQRIHEAGKEILEVKNLSTKSLLKHVSFTLHAGEILGFGGLVGAGRTELVRAVYGADPITSGSIIVWDQEVSINHPQKAVSLRIGLIPEDRKQHGIISELSVRENIAFSSFEKVSRFWLLQVGLLNAVAGKIIKLLRIATPNALKKVRELSGGNQQKVIIGRWLTSDCDIIFFDEPTRGIDVGAKQEIYEHISELASQGKGILFISSDMQELLGMSDRIIVMHEAENYRYLTTPNFIRIVVRETLFIEVDYSNTITIIWLELGRIK